MSERRSDEHAGTARMSGSQRRLVVLLGVLALGLAFTVTVVSTYLPVLIEKVSGPVVVGALIGGEGFFGIFMPALVGSFSDRVAICAATIMTLPFSVLMRLLPEEHHGAASGSFGFSRGVGGSLGPLVTGVAIMLLAPVLSETQGYAAMFWTCSVALLASLPFLLSLRRDSRL